MYAFPSEIGHSRDKDSPLELNTSYPGIPKYPTPSTYEVHDLHLVISFLVLILH